jgi:hypothetical protein
VIPVKEDEPIAGWYGVSETGRLLNLAAGNNQLDALSREVEQVLQKQPTWNGGRVLLALIQARRGKAAEVRPLVETLLEEKKNPMPLATRALLGQELEKSDALRELAVRVYEGGLELALANPTVDLGGPGEVSGTPSGLGRAMQR